MTAQAESLLDPGNLLCEVSEVWSMPRERNVIFIHLINTHPTFLCPRHHFMKLIKSHSILITPLWNTYHYFKNDERHKETQLKHGPTAGRWRFIYHVEDSKGSMSQRERKRREIRCPPMDLQTLSLSASQLGLNTN